MAVGEPMRMVTLVVNGVEQSREVEHRLTLADFLGATRESVNKTLQEWRSRMLIETRRGAVRVSDAASLAGLSEIEEG